MAVSFWHWHKGALRGSDGASLQRCREWKAHFHPKSDHRKAGPSQPTDSKTERGIFSLVFFGPSLRCQVSASQSQGVKPHPPEQPCPSLRATSLLIPRHQSPRQATATAVQGIRVRPGSRPSCMSLDSRNPKCALQILSKQTAIM